MRCPKCAICGVALLTRQVKFFSDDNAYVFNVVKYSRLRSTEDSRIIETHLFLSLLPTGFFKIQILIVQLNKFIIVDIHSQGLII